jgi:hypothetical protein
MWDGFFSALDGLTVRAGAGAGGAEDHRRDLDRLRSSFGELLASDLVGSDASERAALRLDSIAAALVDTDEEPTRRATHAVCGGARWLRDDGTARLVLTLRPTPSVAWERGFAEFERAVYLSASSRPKLRHGTVVLACRPPEVAAATDALQRRVDTYRSALAD